MLGYRRPKFSSQSARTSSPLAVMGLALVVVGAPLYAQDLPDKRVVTPHAKLFQSPRLEPIHYRTEVRRQPAARLHIVTVDLADPSIECVVRPAGPAVEPSVWPTSLLSVRQIADRDGLIVAVNGDYFEYANCGAPTTQGFAGRSGAPARPIAPCISDGLLWSTGTHPAHDLLYLDASGRPHIERLAVVPVGTLQAIGGILLLKPGGIPVIRDDGRAPRTAIGIDATGRFLTMVVVDGRRHGFSLGLTFEELAMEMRRLGCDTAINLDGGGSSTMVLQPPYGGPTRLCNRPSDGSRLGLPVSIERPVASVIGIRRRPQP